jgi:hypothetical protein
LKLEKVLNFLQNHIRILLLLYLAVQLGYVFFSNLNYQSDSLYYFSLAQECLRLHTFYPAPIHLYQDYIIAPLYINILVVILSIVNSKITIGIFNIILNFIQLFLVYKITFRIFNKESAKVVVIVYIFYLSTLGLVLFNYTELIFNVLILSSIYFYLQNNNWKTIISGILLAASIAVRPIGWALLGAYLINEFYSGEQVKKILVNAGIMISGLLVFIIFFGTFNYSHFGKFIFTSTNGPVNLLIAANDDATGAYNNKVFEKGKIGYIANPEKKTYIVKEGYWLNQAYKWIYEHPVKYISLFPLKIVHMFIWDDFTVSRLLNLSNWNLYKVAKDIITGSKEPILDDNPPALKISYFVLQFLHHLYYFTLVVLFIFSTVKNFKALFLNNGLRLFLLFMSLGLCIHLLTYGDARYKYPYIISMMIFIAPVIYNSVNSKRLVLKYLTWIPLHYV